MKNCKSNAKTGLGNARADKEPCPLTLDEQKQDMTVCPSRMYSIQKRVSAKRSSRLQITADKTPTLHSTEFESEVFYL